jgi:hypothetical protein
VEHFTDIGCGEFDWAVVETLSPDEVVALAAALTRVVQKGPE